jgi:hypothetical protein
MEIVVELTIPSHPSRGSQQHLNRINLLNYCNFFTWRFVTIRGKFHSITFLPSVCLSVRTYQIGSTGRIFPKFNIGEFNEYMLRSSKFVQNPTTISDTLHEDLSVLRIVDSDIRSSPIETKHCCVSMTTISVFMTF